MILPRRSSVALALAVVTAGAIGWALFAGNGGGLDRSADGTRVRAPAPDERASAPTPPPDLAGARPAVQAPAGGRPRSLTVIVEGPSGRVEGAAVSVEPDGELSLPSPSIAPPEPGVDRHPDRTRTAATDAQGRASFEMRADSTASIDVAASGFTPRSTTHWFAPPDAPRSVEVARVLLAPAAKIEGRVVDASSGRPIESAAVFDGGADEAGASCDRNGAFRLWTDMATRELRLEVRANGYVSSGVDLALWNGVVEPASITVPLRRPAPRGSIEVTVTDSTGRSVARAEVSVYPAEDAAALATKADPAVEDTATWSDSGRASPEGVRRVLDVPLGRSYVVSASASGYAAGVASTAMQLDAEHPTARVAVTLGELASLIVTLLDPDGRPTGGHVRADAHFPIDAEPDARVGEFQFRGLDPGPVRVTARHGRYLPKVETLELRAGENRTTLRLGLGVTLRGMVVDPEGKPLRDVTVVASPESAEGVAEGERLDRDDAPQERSTRTDARGAFACDGLALGRHRLRASRRFAPGDEVGVLGTAIVDAPSNEVRLVARPLASIRATLLRPNATPLEGSADIWLAAKGLIEHQEAVQVEAGRVRFVEVADGEWTVGFSVGGLAPIEVPVSVRDGRTIDLGSLRFDAGVTVRGRVVDASGHPVEAASVGVVRSSAMSREDGAFELDLVASGRRVLRASAEGYVRSTMDIVASDDGAAIEVRLSRGGIVRGALRGHDADATEGILRFVRGEGDAAETVDTPLRSGWRFFLPLAPGRWNAEWTVPGAEPRTLGSVTIEEGAVRDLDLDVGAK